MSTASGWLYKDTVRRQDGVQKIKLRPGAVAGQSSAFLIARGVDVPMPVPVGSQLFAQDPHLTVQLRNSEGACWTSQFSTNRRNSPDLFKATTP